MGHASRDFANNFSLAWGANLVAQTDNTALVATVTRDNSEVNALALLLGSLADADTTLTLLVEDSDNNSTWATVSAANYKGTLTGVDFADDNTIHVINYYGNKKYWRLTVTPANNTGSLTFGILKITGNGRVQP